MKHLAGLVLALGVALTSPGVQAADTLTRTEDEAPSQWVVYPSVSGLSEEQAGTVRKFLRTAIPTRFPQLEFVGNKVAGGLAFGLKDGQDVAPNTHLHQQLQLIPGLVGAMPVPSASQIIRARARELIRGGITSKASGLIIRYRGSEKRAAADAGEALDAEELARLSTIVGKSIVRSRAMSGSAFVADFSEITDIYEAELAANRLQLDPRIESASVNGFAEAALVSSDQYFQYQWNLTNPTSGINVSPAWDLTVGSSSIVVAVVDTGVLPHPDFAGRLLPGYDFISSLASSNDGDGRDSNAYDSGTWRVAGQCGPGSAARSSTWHGTHVAGIIGAAGDNGMGIAGVNWRSRILPVRVLGACGGTDADIVDGLKWSAGFPVPGVPNNPYPARVINMSLGSPGNCLVTKPEFQRAILDVYSRGATVVVAAGNDDDTSLAFVPASCVGTVKVAAIGPTGDKTSYSNYSVSIEIAAPGGDKRYGQGAQILSTYATGLQSDPGSVTWEYLEGTSMAAPHASGVASLALSLRPTLTVAQVRDLLRGLSRPFPMGTSCAVTGTCGLGILDAGKAIQFVPQMLDRLNFSDMWWRPTESGWGLNLQQQGDILVGTWFTYDGAGQPRWIIMSSLNRQQGQDYFVGEMHVVDGTPFNQINGAPAARKYTKVGNALVAFFGVGINANPNLAGIDSAVFFYDFGGFEGTKPIGRYSFAKPAADCEYTTGSRASLTNYQDLWWKSDEPGWGLNLTHQGDILFATWFTYDSTGQAAWLYSDVRRVGTQKQYVGKLYFATGVPLDQISGSQALLSNTEIGQITLTFSNGESGRFDYVVNGVAGSKPIQRYVFSSPVSYCFPSTFQ